MSEYNELEYKYVDAKSKLKNRTVLLIMLFILCGISTGLCLYLYNENITNKSTKGKIINELTSSYPIRITNIQFGNKDYEGNIITNYGEKLYDFRMRFLHGKITFDSYLPQSKEVEFKIKIRKPDRSISQGTPSPKGFSFTDIRTIPSKSKENTVTLKGWGNSSGGTYPTGEYEYEIWCKECCLYVGYFRIY
jgi:hypothetical protein